MAGKRERKAKQEKEVVGFIGVGLDDSEGHRRVTTGENFFLVGGSAGTHERMIDTAVDVNEQLERRGKRLEDATPDELKEVFHYALKRTKRP